MYFVSMCMIDISVMCLLRSGEIYWNEYKYQIFIYIVLTLFYNLHYYIYFV